MLLAGLLIVLGVQHPYPATAPALPLVVLAPASAPSGTLAIMLTGDGGWSATDKTIANRLLTDGDAVVGLNSLHYFAHKHTSAQVAADVSQIAREYCGKFACQRIVLIGYSMGADVLPFVFPQISDSVRSKIVQLDLVSLGHEAVFKFFPTQWVGVVVGHKFATLPQLALLHGVDVVCIYGTKDPDQACRDAAGSVKLVPIETGHVMSKAAEQVAEVIARKAALVQ